MAWAGNSRSNPTHTTKLIAKDKLVAWPNADSEIPRIVQLPLRRVLLRSRLKLVEASSRAEPIRLAVVDLGVALIRLDLHPTDWIPIGRCARLSGMFAAGVSAVAVHLVRAAAESHHEVEQPGK